MMLLPSGHITNNDQQPVPSSSPPLLLPPSSVGTNGCSAVIINNSTNGLASRTDSPLLLGNNILTATTIPNVITTGTTTAIPSLPVASPNTTTAVTNATTTTTANATTNTCHNWDVTRHLDVLQDSLKDGWTIHAGKEGRLFYCNHLTRAAGWLPPCENWGPNEELPYGWEKALDSKGRSYFINHLNKTSTYEAPDYSRWNDEIPPEPRVAILQRNTTLGFGFVAGSERPVIVRFVTEGGPSVNKLQPGDQILAVNGEDVKEAPRDHVIQLVRSCDTQVTLLVCQPARNPTGPGRKSTILSAGKRAKLRTRPSRVRFAESVCVNGAPLFPPSAFSLGDLCVPPMANVLKVFLENGQTKSFKYDATTTVQDVVTSLRDKLCLNASEHFSLVLEHVKSLKRNKLTLLDTEETLARIAARPGAHKLRCLFRVTFVPVSAAELAQKDLNALDYLYMQCCNDVTQERFAPELQPDVALRLAALHMHQHALANNVSPAKLTVKIVEREFGLERFVPSSLIEGMKRKELRRLIAHFLKLNSQMTGSSTKMLTQLQAKIHYLDIISGLPSYGAKCFSTNQREGVERVLLISPRFGLSQIAGVRNSVPQPISTLEEIIRVIVDREDDITCSVHVQMHNERLIKFSMEDRDACEFSLVLAGYHKLLTGKELPVEREREKYDDDNAPAYLSQHTVFPANWSYLPTFHNRANSVNFLVPPIYHSLQQISIIKNEGGGMVNHCDRNMNTTIPNNNLHQHQHKGYIDNDIMNQQQQQHNCEIIVGRQDEFGLDIHSVMAMELLEEAAKDCGESTSSGCSSNSGPTISVCEAKNEEVLRRVAEMQKMVESSEQYLNEHGELIHEYEIKSNLRQPWNSTSIEIDSDCESLNSSKVSSNEDAPPPGVLKHSDSLVLLAEAINQDLSGITQGLNSINSNNTTITAAAAGVGGVGGGTTTTTTTATKINTILSNNGVCNLYNQNNDNNITMNYDNKLTPKPIRKMNGLSQLLSDLQALGNNDCSQSESDSESVHTPSTSPTSQLPKRNVSFSVQQNGHKTKLNAIRTSFGLHSPDNNGFFGTDTKDNNLREYLRQLKEFSKMDSTITMTTSTIKTNQMKQTHEDNNTEMTAKKLSELYGFEIGEDTLIETDADLIDLRALPPPQTPDELDAFTILNAAPRGFGDINTKTEDDNDLDNFLAKVIVAPPTPRTTPAKELTPEEIMSFIIPPPPNLDELEKRKSMELNLKNSQIVSDINTRYIKYSKENLYSNSSNLNTNSNTTIKLPINERNGKNNTMTFTTKENGSSSGLHIIEYPTVERKGAFSCCAKSKRYENTDNDNDDDEHDENSSRTEYSNNSSIDVTDASSSNNELILPPRRCNHKNNSSLSSSSSSPPPPARPPKSTEIQNKLLHSPAKRITFSNNLKKFETYSVNQNNPPLLPPRTEDIYLTTTTTTASAAAAASSLSPPPTMINNNINNNNSNNNNNNMNGIPPKKPPLPPIALKPILRSPHPLPKPVITSPVMKVAGIGSPHLHRNLNVYRDIDKAFTASAQITTTKPSSSSSSSSSTNTGIGTTVNQTNNLKTTVQFPILRPTNGHYRSNSDCPSVCLKNPHTDNKPQLSLLCSPQMSRKIQGNPVPLISTHNSVSGGGGSSNNLRSVEQQSSSLQQFNTIRNNGYVVVNGETLLAKTDIAMAGLLVKLDQVAAQCTIAQSAGGGSNIDEEKFQKARNELTEQTLILVTASKLLVVAMSDITLASLPEHLTSCLTAIRRITELTQDMTKHTSSPLQTRNIVLKVHDVASSFRELAGVQIGVLGAGQLALQAECLAGVLTTLLRSLRVFSP